jgi:hypothetical protein
MRSLESKKKPGILIPPNPLIFRKIRFPKNYTIYTIAEIYNRSGFEVKHNLLD